MTHYDTLFFLASYLKNATMHARCTRLNLFHAVMLINWSSERDVFNCSVTDSRCILMTYSYNICKHSCCITHMQLRWPKYMVEVAKSFTMWQGPGHCPGYFKSSVLISWGWDAKTYGHHHKEYMCTDIHIAYSSKKIHFPQLRIKCGKAKSCLGTHTALQEPMSIKSSFFSSPHFTIFDLMASALAEHAMDKSQIWEEAEFLLSNLIRISVVLSRHGTSVHNLYQWTKKPGLW